MTRPIIKACVSIECNSATPHKTVIKMSKMANNQSLKPVRRLLAPIVLPVVQCVLNKNRVGMGFRTAVGHSTAAVRMHKVSHHLAAVSRVMTI